MKIIRDIFCVKTNIFKILGMQFNLFFNVACMQIKHAPALDKSFELVLALLVVRKLGTCSSFQNER